MHCHTQIHVHNQVQCMRITRAQAEARQTSSLAMTESDRNDVDAAKIIAAVLLLHQVEGLPIPVPEALAFCYHRPILMGVLEKHYKCLKACLATGLPPNAWQIPAIQAALEMTRVAGDVPVDNAAHSLKRCVSRVFQLADTMRRVGRAPRSLLVQELLRSALRLMPAPEGDSSSDAESTTPAPCIEACNVRVRLCCLIAADITLKSI